MSQDAIAAFYAPNHDETARQAFVGTLKGIVNGANEIALERIYEDRLAPQYAEANGNAPETLEEAVGIFEQTRDFQLWGSSVYTSQDLLWDTVGETIDRVAARFEYAWDQLPEEDQRLGSLTLDPALQLPEPIASTHIHRQPGGYFRAEDEHDLTAPLFYFSSIELYRTAKGLSSGAGAGEPGMMNFMLGVLKREFPDCQPRRILELGCGPGTETIALADAFPDAEIHALDLSAPFVRFGHLWAEDKGKAIHFHQADAADTSFDDASFDLIVSHILFHETSAGHLPKILREAHRLLADGGILLNADVPYQPHRLSMTKRVTNRWQVQYNGEPFWTGFGEMDMETELAQAGFAQDKLFLHYEPLGMGDYYFFGARK